ncbi:hypothetical protein CBR_g30904 [Chara braunii]|uniref:ABC1 atypical kinase-like domain-containing protein n=1 Tax=Chara braunii TaxID=69332 RepID=A0A388LDQ1_CHABU|nr:hypothetical protein CBR_g30904 [Chara braunii]|eukprot:GBG80440.1 hypothetical protein CBR_g30904 [Chara braunii]
MPRSKGYESLQHLGLLVARHRGWIFSHSSLRGGTGSGAGPGVCSLWQQRFSLYRPHHHLKADSAARPQSAVPTWYGNTIARVNRVHQQCSTPPHRLLVKQLDGISSELPLWTLVSRLLARRALLGNKTWSGNSMSLQKACQAAAVATAGAVARSGNTTFRLVRQRCYGISGWTPPIHPVAKAVGAIALTCVRSQVVPRVLAVVVGEATWASTNVAEAEALYASTALANRTVLPPSLVLAVLLSVVDAVSLFLRAVYLMALFTPALVVAPFAELFQGSVRQLWLRLVLGSLERAGAAFIKWGQWAATRPDLFPRDLCQELSELHTKAPSHSFAQTRSTIERAFGKKLHALFEEFEEEPVASGSIAQVHRAVLRWRPSGSSKGMKRGAKRPPTVVAVKVRHPGVSEVIRQDFAIMNWVARISTLVPGLQWLRLDESVQQFAVFMLTQVDLAREAAHLSRFIYNFRHWKDVSFPKPVYPLVHPAVLVETFEQGESVARYVEKSERSSINSTLAYLGTHTLLKMLLVDNFIHADLHPGNILVRLKPRKRGRSKLSKPQPHVVLLDVGMTAELSTKDRVNLLELFKAVAMRDGRRVARCTLKFSRGQSCPDPEGFIHDVEESFKEWVGKKGDSMHAGECMSELLEQVRRHRVHIDGDVCTVVVTTLVLEGWQRKLDPDLNIMQTLQTLLFKADWATSLSDTIDALMAA